MAKKSGGASLRRLFDSAAPLYLIDGKRRIAYCNPAFSDWCGFSLDELADRRVDYHSVTSESPIEEFTAALCPPPQIFADAADVSSQFMGPLATGELEERPLRFVALGNDDTVVGVIGFIELQDLEPSPETSESVSIHTQVARIRREVSAEFQMDRLLGVSPAIRQARRQIEVAAQSRASVVVVGPPGSGREHVARTIYYRGGNDDSGMLVPLSCELLDAELLNTTVDALLNSQDIEATTESALLLLDVDRLTADGQTALADWLLRDDAALQTIASARVPLVELADEGGFRTDLAMALSTLSILLPPLDERREDIPLLAQAFLEEANRLGGRQLGGFSEEALDRLVQHHFAENVDELRRITYDAAANCQGAQIESHELPDEIRWGEDQYAHPRRQLDEIDLDAFLGEIEQELILRAMTAAKGNRAQAAKLLGVSRAKLLRRLPETND